MLKVDLKIAENGENSSGTPQKGRIFASQPKTSCSQNWRFSNFGPIWRNDFPTTSLKERPISLKKRRWKRTFGAGQTHLERFSFWHQSQSQSPQNICHQNGNGWNYRISGKSQMWPNGNLNISTTEGDGRVLLVSPRGIWRLTFWHRPKSPPSVNDKIIGQSEISWISQWNDLFGYDSGGHAQSSINREDIRELSSVEILSPEISRLWFPRKKLVVLPFSRCEFANFHLGEPPSLVILCFLRILPRRFVVFISISPFQSLSECFSCARWLIFFRSNQSSLLLTVKRYLPWHHSSPYLYNYWILSPFYSLSTSPFPNNGLVYTTFGPLLDLVWLWFDSAPHGSEGTASRISNYRPGGSTKWQRSVARFVWSH